MLYGHESTFDYGFKGNTSGFNWGSPTYANVLAFSATPYNGAVLLRWTTGVELNNLGFNIYRSTSPDGPWIKINPKLIVGLGSSLYGGDYYFIDYTAVNGVKYYYMLEDLETGGKITLHGTVNATPEEFYGSVPLLDDSAFVSCGSTDDDESESASEEPEGMEPPAGFIRQLGPWAWVTEESSSRMVIEIRPPDYYLTGVMEGGKRFNRVDMPLFMHTTEPGRPALPTSGILVPIPECGRVSMGLLSKDVRREEKVKDIYTVPGYEEPSTRDRGGKFTRRNKSRSLGSREKGEERFWPERVVSSSGLVMHGTVPLVLLTVNPCRYSEGSERVRSYSRMVVLLRFEGCAPRPPAPAFGTLQEYVSERTRIKVYAKESGIYRIGSEALASAFGSWFDPRCLMLVRGGRAVPMFVFGETDGSLDSGDYAEFYCAAYEDEYTNKNVYYIVLSDGPAPRMAEIFSAPSGGAPQPAYFAKRHFEQNNAYVASLEGAGVSDRWMWNYCYATAGSPRDTNYSFNVSDVAVSGVQSEAMLTLTLQGVTNSQGVEIDHHAGIIVNGLLLTEAFFKGREEKVVVVSVPHSILREGVNTLTIRVFGDTGASYDLFYMNYFELEYWRKYVAESGRLEFSAAAGEVCVNGFNASAALSVYEVSDAYNPVRLTGVVVEGTLLKFRALEAGRFTASDTPLTLEFEVRGPSVLRRPTCQYDYVIVTHAEFRAAAELLAAHRESEGMSVLVADAEDVYDSFSDGFECPEAIRAMLAYAASNWRLPGPRYALMMGDASIDTKEYQGFKTNFVPTKFIETSRAYIGSDGWIAAFAGSDMLPDVYLGRLPVSTLAEANAAVAKIMSYESSVGGPWQNSAILVSDVSVDFDFENAVTNVVAGAIPDYVNELRLYSTMPNVRTILAANWNAGAGVVHFAGHGAADFWGGSVKVFTNGDARGLTNGLKLPLVLVSNCVSANFTMHKTAFECVGEDLVENPNGGAIAVFASSGFTTPLGQAELNRYLLERYYSGEKRVGVLADEAKRRIYSLGEAYSEVLETWTLLGDPATRLK